MKIIGGPAALSGDLWRRNIIRGPGMHNHGVPRIPMVVPPPPGTVSGRQRAPGTWVVAPQLRRGLLPASFYWKAEFEVWAWFGVRGLALREGA